MSSLRNQLVIRQKSSDIKVFRLLVQTSEIDESYGWVGPLLSGLVDVLAGDFFWPRDISHCLFWQISGMVLA